MEAASTGPARRAGPRVRGSAGPGGRRAPGVDPALREEARLVLLLLVLGRRDPAVAESVALLLGGSGVVVVGTLGGGGGGVGARCIPRRRAVGLAEERAGVGAERRKKADLPVEHTLLGAGLRGVLRRGAALLLALERLVLGRLPLRQGGRDEGRRAAVRPSRERRGPPTASRHRSAAGARPSPNTDPPAGAPCALPCGRCATGCSP